MHPRKYPFLSIVLPALLAVPALAQEDGDRKANAGDTLTIHAVSVLGKNGNTLPGSAQALDRAAIERQDYSDIHRALREIPGVQVMEEEGYGLRPNISIRGTAMSRAGKIAIMEDGLLTSPAPYSDPAAYYFPTMGRMSAVEVRKGSSQVPYGPATTGGVLNLVSTPIPADKGGKLQLMIGQDAEAKVHSYYGGTTSFGWLNVGVLAETYQHRTDGFKGLPGNAANYPDHFQKQGTGFSNADYVGKLRLSTGPAVSVYQELEFKAGKVQNYSDETYLGLSEADFNANPTRRYAASAVDNMNVDQNHLSARYFIRPLENLDVTARVYRNEVHRDWYKLNDVRNAANDGWVSMADILKDPVAHADLYDILTGDANSTNALRVRENNRKYEAYGVSLGTEYRVSTGDIGHAVNVGLRYHYDESDRFQHDDRYGMLNGRMTLAAPGTPGSQDNRMQSTKAYSAFVEDAISWNKLTVTPGLRYEYLDYAQKNWGTADTDRNGTSLTETSSDVSVLVWGVGLNYALLSDLDLFTGLHKGFQAPGPGANDSAEAEQSINVELGVRYAAGPAYAQATGFAHFYSNLLGRESAAVGGSSTAQELHNGGKALIYGAELAGGYDLGSLLGDLAFRIPVRAAYTFLHGEFQSAFNSSYWGGNVTKGDNIPYIAAHTALVALGAEYGPVSLDAALAYTGETRTTAGTGSPAAGTAIGDYATVDVTANYRLNENLRLVGAVKNLLDETGVAARTPAGLRPNLPRHFSAGIVADF